MVPFCSKECIDQGWAAHKPACRQLRCVKGCFPDFSKHLLYIKGLTCVHPASVSTAANGAVLLTFKKAKLVDAAGSSTAAAAVARGLCSPDFVFNFTTGTHLI